LQANVKTKVTSQVQSMTNIFHQTHACNKHIYSERLDFNRDVKSKVNSITNHKPGGGNKCILSEKLNFRTNAKSKVGSLENLCHKPQGGNLKVSHASLVRYLLRFLIEIQFIDKNSYKLKS